MLILNHRFWGVFRKGGAMMLAGMILGALAVTAAPGLPPIQESFAFKQYAFRKPNELSKILYLLDRFKNADYRVLYNGMEYDAVTALKYARQYVSRNYRQENALAWIRSNAYRSNPEASIIYLKLPDLTTRELRDVLLEELRELEELASTGGKS